MKNTFLLILVLLLTGSNLNAQGKKEDMTVNKVVNTLKERVTLARYTRLGYTYDGATKKTNTFDIKRIIFMAHGRITSRWTCDFIYDFYNGGMLFEAYTDYQILPGLRARIGESKVPYTVENELSPTTVELIDCYSQSVCYLAGVNGSDVTCGVTSGRDIGMMIHGGSLDGLLYYKLAVMDGRGLNIKDENNQKDIIGSLIVNPLKWLSVGGSFIKRTRYAIADSEVTSIPVGENYAKNRRNVGGIITASPFSLRSEYLVGRDGTVKSNDFYVTGSCRFLRNFDLVASYDYLNVDKAIGRKQANYIVGLQY